MYIKKYTYEERIKYHRANKKRHFYQCNKKSDPSWHSPRTEAEIIRQDITTPRQALFLFQIRYFFRYFATRLGNWFRWSGGSLISGASEEQKFRTWRWKFTKKDSASIKDSAKLHGNKAAIIGCIWLRLARLPWCPVLLTRATGAWCPSPETPQSSSTERTTSSITSRWT